MFRRFHFDNPFNFFVCNGVTYGISRWDHHAAIAKGMERAIWAILICPLSSSRAEEWYELWICKGCLTVRSSWDSSSVVCNKTTHKQKIEDLCLCAIKLFCRSISRIRNPGKQCYRHTVIGIVSYGYSVINLLYHIKHQIAIGLNHFFFCEWCVFWNYQQERLLEIQNSSRST